MRRRIASEMNKLRVTIANNGPRAVIPFKRSGNVCGEREVIFTNESGRRERAERWSGEELDFGVAGPERRRTDLSTHLCSHLCPQRRPPREACE